MFLLDFKFLDPRMKLFNLVANMNAGLNIILEKLGIWENTVIEYQGVYIICLCMNSRLMLRQVMKNLG